MNLEQQFSNILTTENGAAVLPLIKDLSSEEKKKFAPFLKKQLKYYLDYITIKPNTWGQRATPIQSGILTAAAFLCLDYKDYNAKIGGLDRSVIEPILAFYQPSWFNKLINELALSEWMPFELTYHWMMELTEQGIVVLEDATIVHLLCQAIFEHTDTHKKRYQPRNLEKYEITLKEHFWLFFHFESNVYAAERWMQFEDGTVEEDTGWLATILKMAEEQKLPRKRLLKESINATTRPFNRNHINWYIDLFTALQPTKEELLGLQADLFQAFNATQSKPINEVLKFCKQLVKSPEFHGEAFLENVPILLASETKSIVNSTLMVLDKLAAKREDLQEQICVSACTALIQNDEAIQVRAAKLIAKYGEVGEEELMIELDLYQEDVLTNTRNILVDFWDNEVFGFEEEPEIEQEPEMILDPDNEIPEIRNLDELIFLTSQILDGNESWHFDLLPATLLKFQSELNLEVVERLAPAFQRVYKIVYTHFEDSRTGLLNNLLAHFLYDYLKILMERFPNAQKLKNLQNAQLKKEATKIKNWHEYKTPNHSLRNWIPYIEDRIYLPFKNLLLHALEKLSTNDPLPLLSTPTHEPFWIDPVIFVERLEEYQNKKIAPNPIDWQIAISRIVFENKAEAVALAKAKLSGEYLELVRFLLEKDFVPQGKLKDKGAWKVAAFTKNSAVDYSAVHTIFPAYDLQQKIVGALDFNVSKNERMEERYHYGKQKYEKTKVTYKDFTLEMPDQKKVVASNILKHFFLYDYLFSDGHWLIFQGQDANRFLSLVPNNPQPILATVCNACIGDSIMESENNKRTLISTAVVLLENWRGGSKMAHLFVCNLLSCSDKTARSLGAEIWINGISENNMDIRAMGKIIGQMEAVEFFPLKRLTDLISDTMFKISKKHNLALESMIAEIIKGLPLSPIRNTKKLLEIYRELLVLNQSKIQDTVLIEQLNHWKDKNSFKKVVADILKRSVIKL